MHLFSFCDQVNGIVLHDSDHYEAVDVLKGSGNDITMVVGREMIVVRRTDDDEEDEEEETEEVKEEQVQVSILSERSTCTGQYV